MSNNLSKLIDTFTYEGETTFGGAYTIQGKFGPWQLVPGGSDTLIYMEIPITTGSLFATAKSFDISGMTVTVEINLILVPSKLQTSVKELRFNFKQFGTKQGDPTPGIVTVHSVTDPHQTGVGGYVGEGVAQVLIHNADEVSFVFAEIGLVDLDTASWLKPIQSKYSYHEPVGSGNGYLAILSVTDNRDISMLDVQIGSDIVSSKYPLSFVIAGGLFLQHVIMPSLPKAFPGTDASSFAYSAGTIRLTRKFDLKGVKEGAITYTPVVTSMTITIVDDALSNATSGSVDLKVPNAYLSFSVATRNVLKYDPITNTFLFEKDNNPTVHSDKHIPWYDYLLIALAGGVAVAIFAIVINVVADEVRDSINAGDAGGRLTALSATVVRWSGIEAVEVQDAGLSDAFYLRSNPAR